MKFPKNIDASGRLIRLGMALVLLGLAYWLKSWIVLIIALFVLFESVMSWCVVYQILGKNSCSRKKK